MQPAGVQVCTFSLTSKWQEQPSPVLDHLVDSAEAMWNSCKGCSMARQTRIKEITICARLCTWYSMTTIHALFTNLLFMQIVRIIDHRCVGRHLQKAI